MCVSSTISFLVLLSSVLLLWGESLLDMGDALYRYFAFTIVFISFIFARSVWQRSRVYGNSGGARSANWGGGNATTLVPSICRSLWCTQSLAQSLSVWPKLPPREVLVFMGNSKVDADKGTVRRTQVSNIRAWLDSGANESMFKEDPSIAKVLRSSNTRIGTANRDDNLLANVTGEVELETRTGVALPGFDNVIFAPSLRDNLVSVGKICDGGFTIAFNACGVKIYSNKGFMVQGSEVHNELRDRATGLYPITLYPPVHSLVLNACAQVKPLANMCLVAKAIIQRHRDVVPRCKVPALKLPDTADTEALASLTRVYIREDLDEAMRWHLKCGHVSMKALKLMKIKALEGKKLPETLRCESCIKGKIHRQPHKNLHLQGKPKYEPGEYIATDLMGPYAKSLGGNRYGQLFKDLPSTYRWLFTMPKKTGAYQAITEVILDAKARSKRMLRFLKTDGDGIFTSEALSKIREGFGFIHERAAPGDHDSNPEIERDIRTVFEGTATALVTAGAPAYFWAEAMHHFVYTKNMLPSVPVKEDGKTVFKSPHSVLDPAARTFNLDYLVPFGTLLTCYIPAEARDDGKSPSQKRSFKGAMLGYTSNMCAYKVWDIEKKKKRDISFAFSFVHEGFFPFISRKDWPEPPESTPVKFYPSREAVLDEKEWGIFGFGEEEEEDVARDHSIFKLLSLSVQNQNMET